jgi:pentatricopeptide repeat protein
MHAAHRFVVPPRRSLPSLQRCSTQIHAAVAAASNEPSHGSPRRQQPRLARVQISSSSASPSPPNAALLGRTISDARHHRPQSYAHVELKAAYPKKTWRDMDSFKLRVLLEDCMATGIVSSTLRAYLDEFPILQTNWSHQELVLLVGALIKLSRTKTALALLRHQIRGAPEDRVRLNRVAAESARLGNATVALGVLNIAKHFGVAPDVITYTSAIHACARGSRDRIPRAFHLLKEMLDADVTPNHRTYGAVVLAHARLNQWEDIEELLESLPYGKKLAKSDVYASAIITCSRNRQFVVATKLFAQLVDDDVYVGDKVSSAALAACARTSDMEQLNKILAFIDSHGTPSLYIYNTTISAYGNVGRMDDAIAVYERLHEQEGLSPDKVTFNALILGARRSRRPDLLPRILESMAEHHIPWDVYTLNGLLESCAATGDIAQALVYWQQAIDEQSLRRDRANFETLMGVYYEAGDYQSVLSLWQEDYTCRRRAKTAKTLNYLLRACSKLGDVATATSLLEEFIKRGQLPTAIPHNHLLMTYLQADDWAGAQKQLHDMASEPSFITVFAFTAMMKYALRKRQYQDVLDVLEDFEATREHYATAWAPHLEYPCDALYVLAARAALELHDHARLVELYQSMSLATTPVAVKTELARCVMASCEREEDWRCAVSLYDELSKVVDDETNVTFYEIVVKIVARAGEFERALDVNNGDWYRQNRPDQGWF